jgi:hypothetical protein
LNLDGLGFLAQIAVRNLLSDFSYFYSLKHMVFAEFWQIDQGRQLLRPPTV